MDITKYKVLLRTVECGSFSRVALEQGYTQSGVSHMIKCINLRGLTSRLRKYDE